VARQGTFSDRARYDGAMVQAGLRLMTLGGLYLLLAGSAGGDEVVAAVACATAGVAASLLLRRCGDRQFDFRGVAIARPLLQALRRMPGETGQVGWRMTMGRAAAGALCRRPGSAPDASTHGAATRAIGVLATSVTPNSFVVAELLGRQEVLVHELAPPSAPPRAP
jgi:hypothetical protein